MQSTRGKRGLNSSRIKPPNPQANSVISVQRHPLMFNNKTPTRQPY